jgi:S-adenosylmethionine hydrolase
LTFPEREISIVERRRFFAESREESGDDKTPFIYGDSSGYVGIAVRNGSAAHALHVGFGAMIMFLIGG